MWVRNGYPYFMSWIHHCAWLSFMCALCVLKRWIIVVVNSKASNKCGGERSEGKKSHITWQNPFLCPGCLPIHWRHWKQKWWKVFMLFFLWFTVSAFFTFYCIHKYSLTLFHFFMSLVHFFFSCLNVTEVKPFFNCAVRCSKRKKNRCLLKRFYGRSGFFRHIFF